MVAVVAVAVTLLVLQKYGLVNYFKNSLWWIRKDNIEPSTRIFTNFEFNPADRFDVNETIKYGWIVTGVFALTVALVLAL